MRGDVCTTGGGSLSVLGWGPAPLRRVLSLTLSLLSGETPLFIKVSRVVVSFLKDLFFNFAFLSLIITLGSQLLVLVLRSSLFIHFPLYNRQSIIR